MTTPGVNPLEVLPFARAMRESLWLYPAVETVHIAGFVLLVGSVVMFDLRVLGLSKTVSVRALARHLLPWSWGAIVIVVPTGLLMFSAHAGDFIGNRAFQVKMGLLMLAGANAAWFHSGPFQTVREWDVDVPAPLAAKVSVALSMVLWLGVITCGRFIAYL